MGPSCNWLILQHLPLFQELNNRLAAEITRLRTLLTGEGGGEAAGSPLTQGKDAYELEVSTLSWLTAGLWSPFCTKQFGFVVYEGLGVVWCVQGAIVLLLSFQVLLRVKESEIQYLKQEISSLKDELQTALRVMSAAGLLLQILRALPVLPCVCLDSSLLPPRFETAFHFCP